MSTHILIIDDDNDLLFVLEQIFKGQGYQVTTATDGPQGLIKYQSQQPDIILIDRTMPAMDGLEVVKVIRENDVKTPIIFLTSKTLEEDVISGLEAGANDYIRKPFSLKELVTRVNNFIRFTNKPVEQQDRIYSIGIFTLNTTRNTLSYNGNEQQLTKMESKLLELFVQNKNRIVKTDTIISTLWSDEKDFFSNANLHVHIYNLKARLSADPSIRITNLRTVGYKLEETSNI